MNELRELLRNGRYMSYEEFLTVLEWETDEYSYNMYLKFQEAALLLRQFQLKDLQILCMETTCHSN